MAIQLEMEKRVQTLQLALTKNNVTSIKPSQVKLAMDVSGSFDYEHRNGYTQILLDRFVPFSMVFDIDKKLEVCAFSSDVEELTDLDENNYETYIQNHVMRSRCYNGGTSFVPPLRLLLERTPIDVVSQFATNTVQETKGFFARLFGKKDESTAVIQEPTSTTSETIIEEKNLVFFITDGEAFDQDQSYNFLNENITEKTYILFISIGNENSFLERNFKDTSNTNYLNITLDQLHKLKDTSDEEVYQMILSPKFAEWLNK